MKIKKLVIAMLLVIAIFCTTTAIAAGGYVSKLTMGHVKEGTEITLPENEPEMDGYEFKGWQINGAGETYPAGATVAVDDNLTGGSKEITFKAVWEEAYPWTVKYAVRIYGIEEDVDEYGNEIGLTFGPAGGYNKNYNNSYCAHSGGKDCLHNLTWTEIIEKAHSNPHFFDACLENRCTHSVELLLPRSLISNNYYDYYYYEDHAGEPYIQQSGDGAGALCFSLDYYYTSWNGSIGGTDGGWEASQIRNALNGTKTTNGSRPESESLIAAFPKELQNAIVPRAVKSAIGIDKADTTQAGRNKYDIHTTYDKLWLFSFVEMYKHGGTYSSDTKYDEEHIFDNREGVLYSSQNKMGAVSTDPETVSSVNIFYDEFDYQENCWSRTLYSGYQAQLFGGDGNVYISDAYNSNYGIAPGFCI